MSPPPSDMRAALISILDDQHVVALQRGLAAHEVFHAEPDIQAAATVLEGS